MAFAVRHLRVLACVNGFTLWHYKAPMESMEIVTANDYFGVAFNMLSPGDMIMITAAGGERIVFVASVDINTVTVAPLS